MRRRKWGRGLAVLVLLVGLTALILYRMERQERLDHELLEAIDDHKAAVVASLLVQGADPNAREHHAQPGTFWQRLLTILRGRTQSDTSSAPALWIATRSDLNAPVRLRDDDEAVVRALREHGANAPVYSGKAAASLAWTDRWLRKVPQGLTAMTGNSLPNSERLETSDAIKAVIAKYGPSDAAYALLAECALARDRYADASHWARLALLLEPKNTRAHTVLRDAQNLDAIAAEWEGRNGGKSFLPAGYKVIALRPYPVAPDLWVAAYGKYDPDKSGERSPIYYPEAIPYNGVGLMLVRRSPSGLKKLWQTLVVNSQLGSDYSEYSEADLYIDDMNGDGVPEILLHGVFFGASWTPSHLEAYTWRDSRLKSVLSVNSSDPLWLEDPKRNHHYVVRNEYEIGDIGALSHAGQPRWSNRYAWENGRYRLANADAPKEFAHWRSDLRALLASYPHDYEIWAYLAQTYAILGQREASERVWQRAERELMREFVGDTNTEMLTRERSFLHQIRTRVLDNDRR